MAKDSELPPQICIDFDLVASARDILMGMELFKDEPRDMRQIRQTRERLEKALSGTKWAFRPR